MNFKSKYIDELISIREDARHKKNWSLSDDIRDYLDTKCIFIFDTPTGQVVYHRKEGTRAGIIEEIKRDQRAQKLFDSGLYSISSNINRKAS